MKCLATLTVVLLVTFRPLGAQSQDGGHIFHLDDDAVRPAAQLDDIAWLAGAWEGEAFGGSFEEVWTRPTAGSMVGLFKLKHDGASSMYEIQTITEEEGSLVWKVKHFNNDFSAWEEKAEFVAFPLVKIDDSGAYFDGLSLVKDGDGLLVYLNISEKGETREESITYRPATLRDSEGPVPQH